MIEQAIYPLEVLMPSKNKYPLLYWLIGLTVICILGYLISKMYRKTTYNSDERPSVALSFSH